jgi:hypothetical protein
MTEHHLSRPTFKDDYVGRMVRMVFGSLTVGLLIVFPALKILGLV